MVKQKYINYKWHIIERILQYMTTVNTIILWMLFYPDNPIVIFSKQTDLHGSI